MSKKEITKKVLKNMTCDNCRYRKIWNANEICDYQKNWSIKEVCDYQKTKDETPLPKEGTCNNWESIDAEKLMLKKILEDMQKKMDENALRVTKASFKR